MLQEGWIGGLFRCKAVKIMQEHQVMILNRYYDNNYNNNLQ